MCVQVPKSCIISLQLIGLILADQNAGEFLNHQYIIKFFSNTESYMFCSLVRVLY